MAMRPSPRLAHEKAELINLTLGRRVGCLCGGSGAAGEEISRL